jgi:hypothetical protein
LLRRVKPRNIEGMDLQVGGKAVPEPNQTGSGPSIEGQIAPKRAKTGGRQKGTPNKIAGQIRKDAAAFFRSCTSENVKFRRRLKEFCESGEVLKHSHTLAVLLSHGLGKPMPKVEQPEQRSPLLFVTQHSIGTYDPLAAKAAALAARKAERMLSEAKPDAYEPPKPDDPDALVVVEPGPDTLAARAMRSGSR